jgi:hypothetical protein
MQNIFCIHCGHGEDLMKSSDSNTIPKRQIYNRYDTTHHVSRILKYAEDKEKGTFTPSRERDELSLDLGNPEHTGRVRGLRKLTTWKH